MDRCRYSVLTLRAKSVKEVVKNDGADIRSASAGQGAIVYDRFGELFLYDTASGETKPIAVDLSADLPDVRARISPADREIENYAISPTGVRAVFEAHGDILTVPAKESTTRDITNTPGVMERDPAWSPDGQSIAYFSDESGQYALHISSQTGAGAGEEVSAGERRDVIISIPYGRRTRSGSRSTTTRWRSGNWTRSPARPR